MSHLANGRRKRILLPHETRYIKQAAKGRGQGGQGKSVKVTVSLGAAQRDGSLHRPEMVMKAADKALYRSKKGGRNRLTLANK